MILLLTWAWTLAAAYGIYLGIDGAVPASRAVHRATDEFSVIAAKNYLRREALRLVVQVTYLTIGVLALFGLHIQNLISFALVITEVVVVINTKYDRKAAAKLKAANEKAKLDTAKKLMHGAVREEKANGSV